MDKKLKELVSKSLIFLVSENKLDRMAWKKVFNDLSVKPEQIVFFEDVSKALEAIKTRRPRALICSYVVKDERVDQLLVEYRKLNPDLSKDFTLVVAEQKEESLELASLELELDAILYKPYTTQDLEGKVHEVLKRKASMPKSFRTLFKGFADLDQGKEEAVEKVLEDLSGDCESKPRFQILKAQYSLVKGDKPQAISAYEEACRQGGGYTALSRLFDVLVEESRIEEAFSVIRELVEAYPLHPKRLSDFIKVCILSSNYHFFVEFGEKAFERGLRDKAFGYQLGAGLAICAKSIGIADRKVAIEANLKALKLGGDRIQIVDRALKNLLTLEEHNLVRELVEELWHEESLEETLEIAEYRALEACGEAPFQIFQRGIALTNKGVHDFHVYEVLLRSAKKAGRKPESLEEMADTASKHHPEKSAYFRSLVG